MMKKKDQDPRFSTSRTIASEKAGDIWKDSDGGERPSWDHNFNRPKPAERRSSVGGVNPLARRASAASVPSSPQSPQRRLTLNSSGKAIKVPSVLVKRRVSVSSPVKTVSSPEAPPRSTPREAPQTPPDSAARIRELELLLELEKAKQCTTIEEKRCSDAMKMEMMMASQEAIPPPPSIAAMQSTKREVSFSLEDIYLGSKEMGDGLSDDVVLMGENPLDKVEGGARESLPFTLKTKNYHATIIQTFWRREIAQRDYLNIKVATAVIKLWWKRRLRYFASLVAVAVLRQASRRRKDGAKVVQAWWRRRLHHMAYLVMRETAREGRRFRDKCATTVQTWHRALSCRRYFRLLKQAAIRVQSWTRRIRQHLVYVAMRAALQARLYTKASLIQAMWRGFYQRYKYEYLYFALVVPSQAVIRGFLGKMRTRRRRKFLREAAAAIILQRHVRGLLTRLDIHYMLDGMVGSLFSSHDKQPPEPSVSGDNNPSGGGIFFGWFGGGGDREETGPSHMYGPSLSSLDVIERVRQSEQYEKLLQRFLKSSKMEAKDMAGRGREDRLVNMQDDNGSSCSSSAPFSNTVHFESLTSEQGTESGAEYADDMTEILTCRMSLGGSHTQVNTADPTEALGGGTQTRVLGCFPGFGSPADIVSSPENVRGRGADEGPRYPLRDYIEAMEEEEEKERRRKIQVERTPEPVLRPAKGARFRAMLSRRKEKGREGDRERRGSPEVVG